MAHKKLSPTEKKKIRDRLRKYQKQRGMTRAELYEKKVGMPHTTVVDWFKKSTPTPPGTDHLVTLARTENLNLNWLLLGEGPELQDATVPFGDLAESLHATIAAGLKAGLRSARIGTRQGIEWIPDRFLPDPNALLREVVQRYTDDHQRWIIAMRRAIGRRIQDAHDGL